MCVVPDTIAVGGLAMLSVSLWTARVALTARGKKLPGAAMAAVEASVFVLAFSQLLDGLDAPHKLVAYAIGVAAGTLVALVVDGAVNPRMVKVEIVDPAAGECLLDSLHRAGWPTTASNGDGLRGRVAVISVTTAESQVGGLLATVADVSPDAFWTVSPASAMRR